MIENTIYWTINHAGVVLLSIIFLTLLIYIAWLRWQMSTSKARFALAAIAAIAWCPMPLFAFMSGPLPIQLFNFALMIGGNEKIRISIDNPTWYQNVFAAIITIACMFLIYRFSMRTIKMWTGPVSVNVNELAKQRQDNNIMLLGIIELKRIASRQSDPLASETAINWQQRQADAPSSPAWHDFACSLFGAAFREASFTQSAWRDRTNAWIGKIYASSSAETNNLVLFIFNEYPSEGELAERINLLINDKFDFEGAKLYAVSYIGPPKPIIVQVEGIRVDVISRHYLLRKGLKLTDYARDLIRKFDDDPLGGTDATLKATFVEAHVVRPRSVQRNPLSTVLSAWLNENGRRHIAITGEYGQGKSTAMLQLCAEWARGYLNNNQTEGRIPLLIELRGQNPSEVDPISFLSSWASRYGLCPKQIYNLIRAGEALVIFEGFDELRNAGRAFDRHEHFNALWRMAFPGAKIIFTGRPNFFLDEKEKNRTLRADSSKGAGGNAYTELWELDRLTETEVRQVASGFGHALGKSITEAAKAHPAFFDIVSRPSMLPVVATIWDTIESFRTEGHDLTSAVLLERYLQAIYRRKEEEVERDQLVNAAPEGSSYLLLPRELREVFTLAIVWTMAGSDARNTIPRSKFDSIIGHSLNDVFKAFQQSGVPPHITFRVRAFEERFRDETPADKLERIANEVATAGLFVLDPAGGPTNLRLPHKQFYEYLIEKSAWYVLYYRKRQISQILSSCEDRLSPFEKLLSEKQSLGFFADIIGSDYSIFQSLKIKMYLFVSLLGFKIADAAGNVHKRLSVLKSRIEGKHTTKSTIYNIVALATIKPIMHFLPSLTPIRFDIYKSTFRDSISVFPFVIINTCAVIFTLRIISNRTDDTDFFQDTNVILLATLTIGISSVFTILSRFSRGEPATFAPPAVRVLLFIVSYKISSHNHKRFLIARHLYSSAIGILKRSRLIISENELAKNNDHDKDHRLETNFRDEIAPII